MRLWLEYFDQNESFAKVLPKAGTGDRKLKSLDGNDWILFRLDTPAEFEGNSDKHFLLRSRWRGFKVGGREPTSVFVLLVDDVEKAQNEFDVHDFRHAAWGMVRRL
jgi:hypothetical protein